MITSMNCRPDWWKREDYREAAVREMKEETGLTLTLEEAPAWMEKPLYTTVGLTDEACATVYGRASGEISRENLEENEELEIVLADREEARRIEGRTGGFDVRISAYALYKRRGSIFFFETEVKISRKM